MPKVVAPLTNTHITNAKPKLKEYSLADGQGLYLRVHPNGSKLWVFNYQSPIRRRRANMSFGQFPAVSLARARADRLKSRELVANGIDPKEHRDKESNAGAVASKNTLKAVSDRWFAIRASTVTDRYARDMYNSLATHVFPRLGNKPLGLLTAHETIATLEPVAERGNFELVRRICQRLNMIMDFAVNTGVVEVNRLSRINKAFCAPKKQHLPTIRPERLPELLLAVENANLQKETYYLAHWQLQTMVRPSEAAHVRWDEINLETGLWEIPADRMKKKRRHIIPLTRQALVILETMRPISGDREYVFPSRSNPRKPRSSATINVAFRRMGYKGVLVSHGLRSIASTYLNEVGVDGRVVERALSHVEKNETIRAYNRAEYLPQVRDALQMWSGFIEASMPQLANSLCEKRTVPTEHDAGEVK